MDNRKKAIDNIGRKADKIKMLFNSKAGEEVLKILEEECEPAKLHVPQDSHSTAYNCGKRDVVVYIKQMMRFQNENS